MSSTSVPTMSRKQVKEVVKFSIENSNEIKLPVMIWGWHGVGKTQLIKDVAKELGYNLKILHLATQDIIDLIGRPIDIQRKDPETNEAVNVQEWCVPSWLQDAREESSKNGKPTIFFLDEMNRGPRIVLNAMLPFLIEGVMHTHRVGLKDAIVAASNPPSDDYEVNELEDKAQLDRLGHVVMKTSIKEYVSYLKSTGMDSATIKVINSHPELVKVPNIDTGVELKPSMRSVDYVMRIVGKKPIEWIERHGDKVIHAYLGETFKDYWIAERKQYSNVITMDMLFNYEENKDEITKILTAEIDDVLTTKLSVLQSAMQVIEEYLEDHNLTVDDCKWLISFLKNPRMIDEEVKSLFSKNSIKKQLVQPEINSEFNEFVENSEIFNPSGMEIW